LEITKIHRSKDIFSRASMGKKRAKLKLNIGSWLRNLSHADLRVRAVRGGLQSLRRQVQPAPPGFACSTDEMPALPENSAQGDFPGEFSHKIEAAFHFRSEKLRVHGSETGGQGGVRAAMISRRIKPCAAG
jgi:hypothetical protein